MAAACEFERPVSTWFEGQYSLIPERMQASLKRYVIDRKQPGAFLTAIITNDLCGAFANADEENAKLVGLYVRWFMNVPPAACWGDGTRMAAWLDGRVETL